MSFLYRRFFKSVAIATLCFLVIATISWCLCPKPELQHYQSWSHAWFDKHGRLLRISLANDDRYRIHTQIADINPNLLQATILYEDQNYYSHPGVDFSALFRAFWQTYVVRSRRIGASTITMQVARLRWRIDSSTASGKIQQIFRAIQLARHYSRDEILEAYLNLAPYGRNIEGIGAASLIYFNKSARELSTLEALTLAVIPQNPNQRDPATRAGFEKLSIARKVLFQRWQSYHPESKQLDALLAMPLSVRKIEELPFEAPHWVNYLQSQGGLFQTDVLDSFQDHIHITTLDLGKQKLLKSILDNYLIKKKDSDIKNAAMLLLNYQSMKVEAMIGSSDFFNDNIAGQVNGTLAKRSPGSTLKPFIYSLAFDEGLIHPMSLMRDAPRRFSSFTPENFDKKFLGPLLARDALSLSRNVPAVELQGKLKKNHFYDFLKQAGVSELKEPSHYGLALTLGGAELTMVELSKLYASLANGGWLRELQYFENNSPRVEPQSLYSREAAFLTLDILRDIEAPNEFSQKSLNNSNDIAWKTGTSWAFRDAWSVGISGPYVLAVWIGNFNSEGNPAFIGRSAAGPLLFESFSKLLPDDAWKLEDIFDLEAMNLRKVDMCRETGDLPNKYCPRKESAWFIPGVSPIKLSDIYRRIPINKKTGRRACKLEGDIEYRVYEFWPSDLQTIFRQAGLSLKQVPPYDASCEISKRADLGSRPQIISPQSSITYVITDKNGKEEIELSAVVDSDVEILYWFVDNEFIGKSAAGKPFFWLAKPGRFQLSVVDDSGRQSRVSVELVRLTDAVH